MKFVSTWFSEDLNASETDAIELRRKGIAVDADLANGGFRRKLPAGKTVNVDLPAIGTCGGAGKSLKIRLQLIGIVRKRVEVFTFQNNGTNAAGRGNINRVRIVFHRDLLLLDGDIKLDVLSHDLAGDDVHFRGLVQLE